MPNPLRSESAAFRFVLQAAVYFALIVIGSLISRWVGLAVFVVLTLGVAVWLMRRGEPKAAREKQAPASHEPSTEHRILVVANETVAGRGLLAHVRERAGDKRTRVLVVCPALNTPVRYWASDEDGARDDARQRLDASLAAMRGAGLRAEGEIGDGDPIQAMEDAIRTFQPDEVVVSTHPAGRSHWLERGVVERARERFEVTLTHVVVDLEAERP